MLLLLLLILILILIGNGMVMMRVRVRVMATGTAGRGCKPGSGGSGLARGPLRRVPGGWGGPTPRGCRASRRGRTGSAR